MSENRELLIHTIIKFLSDSRTSTVLLNLATPATLSVWKLPDDLWLATVSSHTASSRRPATGSRATAATHRLDLCPSAWRSCLCASRASTRPRASSSRRKPSCKWPEVSREHEDKQTNALITVQRKEMAAIFYIVEDTNKVLMSSRASSVCSDAAIWWKGKQRFITRRCCKKRESNICTPDQCLISWREKAMKDYFNLFDRKQQQETQRQLSFWSIKTSKMQVANF